MIPVILPHSNFFLVNTHKNYKPVPTTTKSNSVGKSSSIFAAHWNLLEILKSPTSNENFSNKDSIPRRWWIDPRDLRDGPLWQLNDISIVFVVCLASTQFYLQCADGARSGWGKRSSVWTISPPRPSNLHLPCFHGYLSNNTRCKRSKQTAGWVNLIIILMWICGKDDCVVAVIRIICCGFNMSYDKVRVSRWKGVSAPFTQRSIFSHRFYSSMKSPTVPEMFILFGKKVRPGRFWRPPEATELWRFSTDKDNSLKDWYCKGNLFNILLYSAYWISKTKNNILCAKIHIS